jgi:hypothetical protein
MHTLCIDWGNYIDSFFLIILLSFAHVDFAYFTAQVPSLSQHVALNCLQFYF